jgi:hypothetical protein
MGLEGKGVDTQAPARGAKRLKVASIIGLCSRKRHLSKLRRMRERENDVMEEESYESEESEEVDRMETIEEEDEDEEMPDIAVAELSSEKPPGGLQNEEVRSKDSQEDGCEMDSLVKSDIAMVAPGVHLDIKSKDLNTVDKGCSMDSSVRPESMEVTPKGCHCH